LKIAEIEKLAEKFGKMGNRVCEIKQETGAINTAMNQIYNREIIRMCDEKPD
jgi:hypothetical protein